MSDIMDMLLGSKGGMKPYDLFSPEQQSMLKLFLEQGVEGMGGKENLGQGMEQYGLNQFKQNVVPSIMERFRGIAGGQGQNMASSGLGQMLLGGGQQLSENLANQRYGRGLNLAQLGLGQQTGHYAQQPTQGAIGGIGSMLSKFLPFG